MTSSLARLRKRVSRSFDLSMKLLPGPMRRPVSVGYLLARASDTLADTAALPVAHRLTALADFSRWLSEPGGRLPDCREFLEVLDHAGEAELLERLPECLQALQQLDAANQQHVREVVEIILSGQRLDLQRSAETRWIAASDEELDDYCWRVAGCVGRFWTRVGFATLGEKFSTESAEHLETLGIRYGKALQLVNVLRDVPKDLALGRCYLPVKDPADPRERAAVAAAWRDRAAHGLADGERYATALRGRRLRAATVLPARIGWETLRLLDQASPAEWARGVKVTRAVVRRGCWESLLW